MENTFYSSKNDYKEELGIISGILNIPNEPTEKGRRLSVGVTDSQFSTSNVNSLLKKHYNNKTSLGFLSNYNIFKAEDKLILTFPTIMSGPYGPDSMGTSITVHDNKEDLKDFIVHQYSYIHPNYETLAENIDKLDLSDNKKVSFIDKIANFRKEFHDTVPSSDSTIRHKKSSM